MSFLNPVQLKWMQELYLRFGVIFGERFTKPHTELFIAAWYEEWGEALKGITGPQIKQALAHVRLNCKFPPSIAEFRSFCEEVDGLPNEREAFHDAVNQRYTHPIIAIVRRKIGAWDFSHNTQDQLAKQFTEAYKEALTEFRRDPNNCWRMLGEVKEKLEAPQSPEPTKTLSAAEKLSWRERFAMYEKQAAEDRSKGTKLDIPTQDSGKRDEYLIRLSDRDAMNLDHQAAYQRIRLLRQREGMLKCS